MRQMTTFQDARAPWITSNSSSTCPAIRAGQESGKGQTGVMRTGGKRGRKESGKRVRLHDEHEPLDLFKEMRGM